MSNLLDEKVIIDKEFLDDVTTKNWQDIENIQSQINSLSNEDTKTAEFKRLLNNLLTSYYVFTGCVENLSVKFDQQPYEACPVITTIPDSKDDIEAEKEPITTITVNTEEVAPIEDILPEEDFEPFEYFVDFDEPVGEKLTDEDLYRI